MSYLYTTMGISDEIDYNRNTSAYQDNIKISGILNENIINTLNSRLELFQKLQNNWNSKDTFPPSEESIKLSKKIIRLYANYINIF